MLLVGKYSHIVCVLLITCLALSASVSQAESGFDSCVHSDNSCTPDNICKETGCGITADCGCGLDQCQLSGLLNQSLIQPSDHCFDDFISPMINFVYFEDPRTVTELRPIFVNQEVPGTLATGIPAGGTAQLFAAQFRIALSERLSIIAVKDGFIVDKTGGALDTLLDDGWADITAGLKYNLIRDVEEGTLLSAGATYELPIGSSQALQAIGDGEFHFFASAGQRLLNGDAHYLTAFGWRLPVDGEIQTKSIHWSNHFDIKLTDNIYAFTELAWWHWYDSADTGLPLGVAGQDLFNLSATNVTGNNLFTQNFGLKYKPHCNIEIGAAYEIPLTDYEDIIKDRIQAEVILRY